MKERKLYFRKLDGRVVTRTLRTRGLSQARIDIVTVDEGVVSMDFINVPYLYMLDEYFENEYSCAVDMGWRTSLESCANIPVLTNCNNFPRTSLFFNSPAALEEVDFLIGRDDLLLFAMTPGTGVTICIGTHTTTAFDRIGAEIFVPPKVLEECRQAYGSMTIVRGILNGDFLSIWDVPFRNGRDLCFERWYARMPMYEGNFVGGHIPGSLGESCIIVDPEAVAETTLYRDYPDDPNRTVTGVWISRASDQRKHQYRASRNTPRKSFQAPAYDPDSALGAAAAEGLAALVRSI